MANNHLNINLFILLIILLISGMSVNAQEAQGIKSHEIGMLWETMFETGSIPSYAPIQDQMTYPGGDFWKQTRKNMAGRGLWIGTTNWRDKDSPTPHDRYVAPGGFENNEASGFTSRITNYKFVRNYLPRVLVNGTQESRIIDNRQSGFRWDGIPGDEMVETTWATYTGVQVVMTSTAYANHNHNSYIIKEYVLTNNGNTNADINTIELPGQNLEGVYFGFQYYLIPSGDRGKVEVNQHDDYAAYYGNQPGDTLRGLFYMYDGNSNVVSTDDIGDPDKYTGEFLSPQYPGIGILHADKAYDDESDDRSQPSTIEIKPRTEFATPGAGNDALYNELNSGAQFSGSTEDTGLPAYDGNIRQPVAMLVFGPYNIPFGEDIKIVIYDAVGALSARQCINAGQAWINGNLDWNGLTGDAAKNAMLATGKDSLFMHAQAAEYAWEIGLENIPKPLPTPDLDINAGPGRVELEWSSVEDEEDPDTGEKDFSGYRIYRAEGKMTNLYSNIWECGGNSGNEVVHSYFDENVERGKSYWYAVTSFDDGSQNTTGLNPGESMESSVYYNRNYQYPGVSNIGAFSSLDSVYVVPNPYHIRGLAFGGSLRDEYTEVPRIEDKISFFGLPYRAIIRIFTVSGDLVETIQHPNPENPNSITGAADEAWFSISQSYQIIKSGVYLYYIEGWDKNGNSVGSTTGKLIIIR